MQLSTSLPPSILPSKCYHQERFWLKRKWKADDFWHLNGDNWDLLDGSAIGVSAKQMERLITVCCEAALIYDKGREEGASEKEMELVMTATEKARTFVWLFTVGISWQSRTDPSMELFTLSETDWVRCYHSQYCIAVFLFLVWAQLKMKSAERRSKCAAFYSTKQTEWYAVILCTVARFVSFSCVGKVENDWGIEHMF